MHLSVTYIFEAKIFSELINCLQAMLFRHQISVYEYRQEYSQYRTEKMIRRFEVKKFAMKKLSLISLDALDDQVMP